MKLFFFFLFSFVAITCQAQLPKYEHFLPEIYLDSVKYGAFPNFDINQIDDMSVAKETKEAPRGKIFIKSKHPRSLNLLSIDDINARYRKNALAPMIYMLNNEILKEVSTFRIDSAFILKVEILKGSETDYLNVQFPDLTILKIITRTKDNIDKQNAIRIRGTETRPISVPANGTSQRTIIRLRGVSTASM
jgi:hypothetical protein